MILMCTVTIIIQIFNAWPVLDIITWQSVGVTWVCISVATMIEIIDVLSGLTTFKSHIQPIHMFTTNDCIPICCMIYLCRYRSGSGSSLIDLLHEEILVLWIGICQTWICLEIGHNTNFLRF